MIPSPGHVAGPQFARTCKRSSHSRVPKGRGYRTGSSGTDQRTTRSFDDSAGPHRSTDFADGPLTPKNVADPENVV